MLIGLKDNTIIVHKTDQITLLKDTIKEQVQTDSSHQLLRIDVVSTATVMMSQMWIQAD